MKLPENSEAFADLVKRGVHPAFEDLQDSYPIQNRKLFSKLQQICSQLAHWSPIFAEAPYLPALVFPFLMIYNGDELAALETVMTIMMYWGYSWHVTHPNPPVHLIDCFNALLKLHDLKLYQFLTRLHVVPGLLAWQMMSTMFTEICSRNAWTSLVDFLFTHFTNSPYLMLVPLAIIKDIKNLIYSVDSDEKIKVIVSSQQHLRMESIIANVRELYSQTPVKYFSAIATKYLDNSRFEIGQNMVKDTKVHMEECDEVKVNLALANGQPKFPIPPSSTYPLYDGFPMHLIDMQIQQRNKVLNLQKEVKRRNQILQELESKIQSIESEHQQWLIKHTHATEIMQKQRVDNMQAEKQYLRELQSIEEEISLQRIRQLEVLEKTSKEELSVLDKVVESSAKEVQENEQHLKEKMEMMMNLQKYREMAEQAEVATMEKLREVRMRRQREEVSLSILIFTHIQR